MRLHLFIALRYLLVRKRQTILSVLGVAIGGAVLICQTGLMQGFQEKFVNQVNNATAHVTIYDDLRTGERTWEPQVFPASQPAVVAVSRIKPPDIIKRIKRPDQILHMLDHLPFVVAASTSLYGNVIYVYGTTKESAEVIGIQPLRQRRVTNLEENIEAGSLAALSAAPNGVLLGAELAAKLGARIGDTINATSEKRTMSLRVVGLVRTGVTQLDERMSYCLLSDAQVLLGQQNIINRLQIKTTDYDKAEDFAGEVERLIGYRTVSWQEANRGFLSIFKIQNTITALVVGAILIVSAFGIWNILMQSVMEKVHDIAILRSFGLTAADIRRIYLIQGLLLGVAGGTLACLFGAAGLEAMAAIRINVRGIVMAEGLLISRNPVYYAWAFGFGVLSAVLASTLPARRAAALQPVDVIRGAH